jgi:hypothetical protein
LPAAPISIAIYGTNKMAKEFSIVEICQSTNYNRDEGIMIKPLTKYYTNVIQKTANWQHLIKKISKKKRVRIACSICSYKMKKGCIQ